MWGAKHPYWENENYDIAFLNEAAGCISSSTSPDEISNEAIRLLTSAVSFDACMIYLLENDYFVLSGSFGACRSAANRVSQNAVARDYKPLTITECAHEDFRCAAFQTSSTDHFETFVSAPMISHTRLVGFINLRNRLRSAVDDRQLKVIMTLASMVATSLEIHRLIGENESLVRRMERSADIEKATKILQTEMHLSQRDAYLFLQKESRRRRKPMAEVANAIILCSDMKAPGFSLG